MKGKKITDAIINNIKLLTSYMQAQICNVYDEDENEFLLECRYEDPLIDSSVLWKVELEGQKILVSDFFSNEITVPNESIVFLRDRFCIDEKELLKKISEIKFSGINFSFPQIELYA